MKRCDDRDEAEHCGYVYNKLDYLRFSEHQTARFVMYSGF